MMQDTQFERLTTEHMNFRIFCDKIVTLVHVEDDESNEFWDDEYLNELYEGFKTSSFTDITEWANDWFEGLKPETHDFYLKSKLNG